MTRYTRPNAKAATPRGPITTALGWTFVAYLTSRMLAVDVFAMITNDSLLYLSRAREPLADGLIVQGYRQLGYPTSLWILDQFDATLGFDRVFAIAALQRVLLAVGLIALWHKLRWWAAPSLVLLSASTMVVLTNFVLTEGMLFPLGLLLAVCLVMACELNRTRVWYIGWLTAALVFVTAMASMKLQYSALTLPVLGVFLTPGARRTLPPRLVLGMIALPSFIILTIAAFQTVENGRELGVYEPVGERARAAWYGAWQGTFQVHPERRADPALTEFYDSGNLYTFLHGLERDEPDYLARRSVVSDRIDAMFAAASTSRFNERIAAFLGATRGGRTDDIQGLVDMALSVEPESLERAYGANWLAESEGPSEVLNRENGGASTDILMSSTVALDLSTWPADYRGNRHVLWLGILVLCVATTLLAPEVRYLALGMTLALIAIAAALGSAYIDNARYLVPGTTVAFGLSGVFLRGIAVSRGWIDSKENVT